MMETGDTTCNDLNMSSFGMSECIEAVRKGSGWDQKKGKMPKGKGIGMTCGFFVSGAGYPIYRSDTWHGTVIVKLTEDGGTAQVAEVTVDMETGQVTIDKITDAHDCGKAINLTSVEGQMQGAGALTPWSPALCRVGQPALNVLSRQWKPLNSSWESENPLKTG